jgi:hypothetical protein
MTAEELKERMPSAEFDRHMEDQKDCPDAPERTAHLLYIVATLLNDFMYSWTQGKFRLESTTIAPWIKVRAWNEGMTPEQEYDYALKLRLQRHADRQFNQQG